MTEDEPDRGTWISCVVVILGCALVAVMIVVVVALVRALPAPECCPAPPSQVGVLAPPPG